MWVKKGFRHGRCTATTVQKTTPKLKKTCEVLTSITPYLISEEIFNIMTLRPSQRRTPEQICCGIWTNVKMDGRIYQPSFSAVALKLTVALPNQLFSLISSVPLHREWRHHELSFSLRQACVTSLSLYTLKYVFHPLLRVVATLGDGRHEPQLRRLSCPLCFFPHALIFSSLSVYFYFSFNVAVLML